MKRLTSTVIQRTRVEPGGAVWITDEIERGLRVRISVTKRGNRNAVFYYRYRDRSTKKLTNKKIGTFGSDEGMSLEKARSKVRELRAAVEKGISAKKYLQSQINKRSTEEVENIRTLAISFSDYLDTTTLSEATKTTYRRYLRAIAYSWVDYKPDEITPDDCEALFNTVLKNGVPDVDIEGDPLKNAARRTRKGGHRAAGHLLATGSRFWERMKRQRKATTNPWARMKELRERSESHISDFHLDDEQIKDFLLRAKEILKPREYRASLILLGTGLRPTEVLGAKTEEFDLTNGKWLIPATRMKYKKSDHLVFLSEFVVDVIKEIFSEKTGDHLFPSYGGKTLHLTTDHLGNMLHKFQIEGFSPKGFRATVRTGLQQLGCPEEVRSRMSHHQRLDRVAKSYDQYHYDDEAREWWQKWGEKLHSLK